jgi:hypothetical protein
MPTVESSSSSMPGQGAASRPRPGLSGHGNPGTRSELSRTQRGSIEVFGGAPQKKLELYAWGGWR